jgi:hypothetical protein
MLRKSRRISQRSTVSNDLVKAEKLLEPLFERREFHYSEFDALSMTQIELLVMLKAAPVEKIPDGYQVEESVNGIVSLVKAHPQLILPEELARVETALKKHPKAYKYRAVIKNDQIVIYESQGTDFDWIYVGSSGKIDLLVKDLIPTVGTDDFYELY